MRDVKELPRRGERSPFAPLLLGATLALAFVALLVLLHPGTTHERVDQLLLAPELLGHTFDDFDPQTKVRRSWLFDRAELDGQQLSSQRYEEIYQAMKRAEPIEGRELRLIFTPQGRYAASYEPICFQTVRFYGSRFVISEGAIR